MLLRGVEPVGLAFSGVRGCGCIVVYLSPDRLLATCCVCPLLCYPPCGGGGGRDFVRSSVAKKEKKGKAIARGNVNPILPPPPTPPLPALIPRQVMRRSMWNVFRLEWECIQCLGGAKAVRLDKGSDALRV